MYVYVYNKNANSQIHQFTQQIVLHPLTFTASGFFSIDNILTGKVCYLFICLI